MVELEQAVYDTYTTPCLHCLSHMTTPNTHPWYTALEVHQAGQRLTAAPKTALDAAAPATYQPAP